MTHGICRSNRDEFRPIGWPEVFSDCIKVGDRVQNGNGMSMTISSITHSIRSKHDFEFADNKKECHLSEEPFIIVELTKGF